MATIKSDNSTDQLRIDAVSKAARVTTYTSAGVEVTQPVSIFDFSSAALLAGATYTSQTFDTSLNGYGESVAIMSVTNGTHFTDESNDGTNWVAFDSSEVVGGVEFNDMKTISSRYFRIRFVNGAVENPGGVSNFFHSVSQRASLPNQAQPITRISDNNLFSGAMTANGTYQGLSEVVEEFTTISISVFSPYGVSLNGTLWIQVSRNGNDWSNIPRDIRGSDTSQPITFLIAEKFFRIFWENGVDKTGVAIPTTNTSSFQIQVMFANGRVMDLGHQMGDTISDNTGGGMTKSVLTGRLFSGKYKNIGVDAEGRLRIANPMSAFDEVQVIQPNPVVQLDFVYGINTQLATSIITGSGTATVTAGLLSCKTTAAANSSAILHSRRYLKHRAGQGGIATFDALFTSGAANSNQYAGLGTASLSNGFLFGFLGVTFGIFKIDNSVVVHTAQTAWNVDLMDGSNSVNNPSGMLLVKTNFNLYQIEFQYGGGSDFYIQNPINNELVLVHRISHVNSSITQSIRQPSLNIVWAVVNTSNTSDITVKASSAGVFVEGIIKQLGANNAVDNNKSAITTLTNILALRNATTYNTITNRAQARLKSVSFGYDDGNGLARLRVILNPTLGGVPVFTPINGTTADNGVTITSGQSTVSFDTAGTTVTGGTTIFNALCPRFGSQTIDLSDLDLFLSPTDVISFAVTASSAGLVGVSVNWVEDI